MLWAVLPGAVLVLYRIQRLSMAAVFAAIALAGSIAAVAEVGVSPLDSAWQVAAQGPLVYFAGFMLSEPLTMPGRRSHRLGYAAVIAIAYSLPFSFGPISGSPELALLIGNLLAFALGLSRGVALRFVERRQLTPTSQEFVFVPSRHVRFAPGQYAEVSLPGGGAWRSGMRRTFSFTSSPASDLVAFGVSTAPPLSAAKRSLIGLVPGQKVHLAAFGGDFVLPRDVDEPLLLVAGGIGITPFASMLRAARSAHEPRDVVVLASVQTADELAFADILEASNARVMVRSSDGAAAVGSLEDAGSAPFSAARLRELVPDLASRTAYVSGPPSFVGAVAHALHEAGARRVRRDAFSGY